MVLLMFCGGVCMMCMVRIYCNAWKKLLHDEDLLGGVYHW